MKRIELTDRELSKADYSNFELNLQTKGGAFTADLNTRTTPAGTEYVQLSKPAVEFEESQSDEAEIDQLLQRYGFGRRMP